jgi:flavin reductase (DIM6/NTAB) family NADH-FMN oxidoreductase RutF
LPVSSADFIAGMRRHAAGVTIVTTRLGGIRAGLTATSVCSITAEPPRLLVCVQRDADAHDIVLRSRLFAVNVLTPAQRAIADRFGGLDESRGPSRFALGDWMPGITGAPLLAGAAASFECALVETVAASTHSVFIGQVEAARFDEHAPALAYHDRTYHALGGSPR